MQIGIDIFNICCIVGSLEWQSINLDNIEFHKIPEAVRCFSVMKTHCNLLIDT